MMSRVTTNDHLPNDTESNNRIAMHLRLCLRLRSARASGKNSNVKKK